MDDSQNAAPIETPSSPRGHRTVRFFCVDLLA
nr:MAG TPA: hypothetical protein [Caudoviricetes sp.]